MTRLTAEQVAQFNDQGFLVVKNLLDPEKDIDPIIAEYHGVLSDLAKSLYSKGEITSCYDDLSFSQKLIKIQQETGKVFVQNFDFSLPQYGIKFDTPIWLGKAVFDILRNERLLDAIECLVGPEIYCNPVHHVRLKMPERAIPDHLKNSVKLSTTPWHQDAGVVLPEADDTGLVTVWFPLWDAPMSAGPLKVVPRSHREGMVSHCPSSKGGVEIPEKLIDEQRIQPLPLQRGDILIMHRLMCHASLPNYSENIRWSFDLRYHPVGQPTGRPEFPGFVARSAKNPDGELHDADAWANRWLAARERLARQEDKAFNRWDANAEVCA